MAVKLICNDNGQEKVYECRGGAFIFVTGDGDDAKITTLQDGRFSPLEIFVMGQKCKEVGQDLINNSLEILGKGKLEEKLTKLAEAAEEESE